jgi:hypothetical protein
MKQHQLPKQTLLGLLDFLIHCAVTIAYQIASSGPEPNQRNPKAKTLRKDRDHKDLRIDTVAKQPDKQDQDGNHQYAFGPARIPLVSVSKKFVPQSDERAVVSER